MSKKLLVVIDYQNDFVTGSLGNPAAAALADGIAARVEGTLAAGGCVLFTRDTHHTDYLDTREGKFLPVPHCIEGTDGWHLYGPLARYEHDAKAQTEGRIAFVNKPTFGSAALPAAVEALCGGAPDSIEICGVVTDICVISNAIVLHTNFLDAELAVLGTLCAAATPEGHARALAVLAGMGYRIV
ncbi:MAG: isochorismatase family protein [Ruthenibacterium sp.]